MPHFDVSTPHVHPHPNILLAAIVDSSFDAIISKDLNSIITSWNPAACQLFGYSDAEAIGRSVLMLIPDELRQEESDIINRIRRGERVQSFETTRLRKDGSRVAVSLTISPLRDGSGSIIGASKIARDISLAKENERRIRLLLREVNHRVKNQFAVILSMVRETAKGPPEDIEESVRNRIMALSRSHDLLVNSEWSGGDLRELLVGHLDSFVDVSSVEISGPTVTLTPNAVQNLGMAFHELGTNSAKHGALSQRGGELSVRWHLASSDGLELEWIERFGFIANLPPTRRKGFGTVVLQRVTAQSLGGRAILDLRPDGLRWALSAPLDAVAVGQDITT